jgi:Leucine-rich repeat (LRR) protein
MPNLEWISLEFCPINSIRPGAFSCVPKLKRLEIRDTWLLNDCVSLSELANVETLDLSDNKLSSVNNLTAHLVLMSTTLKVLRLQGNQFTSLDARAFTHFPALEILDLTFNHIQKIERGAFSGLVNLQELLLNKNNLIEPFDLSLVFDPELVNLRVVDLATLRIWDDLYGWNMEHFRTVKMNGDFQKVFASFKNKILLILDCSRLQFQTRKFIFELRDIGLIHLKKS